ncbi:hypothetical protein GOODEAATRI_010439, partial [Goodea atripinnis]
SQPVWTCMWMESVTSAPKKKTSILFLRDSRSQGRYTFFKVLPGSYDITASHPSWSLEKVGIFDAGTHIFIGNSKTAVHVSNANALATEHLVVGGYDVSGEVRSDGEPMKEVTFLLYSATDISGCNTSPVDGADHEDSSLVYLCSTQSRNDGTFTFPSLASGEYTVPIFRVMGFSVTGRVLNSADGEGVPDATVSLNNQIKGKHYKEDGSFRLENMTAGVYTIRVNKELMFFETITVKIAPNTPQLPDIITAGCEFFQDGSKPENVGIYNLSKGVNRFCLSKPVRHHMTGLITTDKMLDVTVTIKSSIESEPALVLGPLRSLEEQRQEQQLQEIQLRRQERERRAAEEQGGARDDRPPIQEKADELTGPFHYEFSYWARAGEKITVTPSSKELLFYPPEVEATITGGRRFLTH